MKYLPTGLRVLPPAPVIYLSHGISLGFMGSVPENHLAMQLIDAPVS